MRPGTTFTCAPARDALLALARPATIKVGRGASTYQRLRQQPYVGAGRKPKASPAGRVGLINVTNPTGGVPLCLLICLAGIVGFGFASAH